MLPIITALQHGAVGVTGSEANTRIHIHRGILGDDNLSGGSSDLDSAVHRWLNPVAKLLITVKKEKHDSGGRVSPAAVLPLTI